MIFSDAQFLIVVTITLFALFFHHGYLMSKRSGGFFMIFSGLIFLSLVPLVLELLDSLATALMVPIGIFIIIMGVYKFLFFDERRTKVN